jgi:pyruvate dehydrogenase (quinone)
VIVPNDVQELPAVPVPPRKHGTVHSGIGSTASAAVPNAAALGQAADIINAGSKVAILAGAGALHATDELIHAAERLGAGIAKALLGKAVVPDDLPFVTGGIGFLGTRASQEMMDGCDTLLMVGSGFPYAEFLPEEGKVRGVQIDIDARMLSLRYPMEVNLVGDSATTLRALLRIVEAKGDRAWRQKIEKSVADWWRTLAKRWSKKTLLIARKMPHRSSANWEWKRSCAFPFARMAPSSAPSASLTGNGSTWIRSW